MVLALGQWQSSTHTCGTKHNLCDLSSNLCLLESNNIRSKKEVIKLNGSMAFMTSPGPNSILWYGGGGGEAQEANNNSIDQHWLIIIVLVLS